MTKSPYLNTYFFYLICILFLSSCEENIEFKYDDKIITSTDFDICATQDCPEIDFSYVTFTDPTILHSAVEDWIKQTVSATLNQSHNSPVILDDIFKTFINNSQTGYPETITLSDTHEFNAELVVLYTSNDIVSLGYYADVFDGGAHGFYQEKYANFNPKTGDLLKSDKFVKDTFYAFAKAQLENKYPNTTFDIKTINVVKEPALQIGFSTDGVLLRYEEQDIFPVTEDEYKLTIPWSEAEEYLTF